LILSTFHADSRGESIAAKDLEQHFVKPRLNIGEMKMNYWNEQADKLERTLLENPRALVLHFIRTASPEALLDVAGDALADSDNARASVVATLAARLDEATRPDVVS
jgi:hypothetical protein